MSFSLTSRKKSIVGKKALSWLFGATSLLYVLSRFLPCAPQQHYGVLEDSWMQVLHTAFQQHWQFGRDIVFVFGPWGFLYGGFHPSTHLVSLLVWSALALTFWWAGWQGARHFFGNEIIACLWFVCFVAASSVTPFLNMDARLMAFAALLLLHHFFVEGKSWTVTQAALTISLGLLSLIKFSEFLLAVVVVLAVAAHNVLHFRRLPWVLPIFGVSLVLFWALAGQHLNSLAPFLSTSWGATSGYAEAVMLTGPNDMRDAGYFVAAATLLCGLLGAAAWMRHRLLGIIPWGGFCFILFAAFKYGYVRHDGHEVAAVSTLLMMSLVSLALLWPLARNRGHWAVIASFLPTVGICIFAAITFSRYSQAGLPGAFVRTFSVRELFAPLELLWSEEHLLAAHEKFMADFRGEFPLPPIKGSVDVYPSNQVTALAHGFDYRPRPGVQSYSTYTPELAVLNAAFLRSDRAPENILFEIWPIDDRLPSLDDALSWPELLTRYEVVGRAGNFARLQPRTKPRSYKLIPLSETSFEFGTKLDLPSTDDGPIWAEIEIHQSLEGKITSFLFKPPILWMTTTLKDGRTRPFRIVPNIARSGFLISPVVDNTKSFALLSLTTSTTAVKDYETASIILSAETKSGTTSCYQSPLRLRLYRLDISDSETR